MVWLSKLFKAVYSVIHTFKCHFANTRDTNLMYWGAETSFTLLEGIKFNSTERFSEQGRISSEKLSWFNPSQPTSPGQPLAHSPSREIGKRTGRVKARKLTG